MKKPRVEDFDPKAAPTLGSPLDTMPQIYPPVRTQPAEKQGPQAPVVPVETPRNTQSPSATSAVTPEAPASPKIERSSTLIPLSARPSARLSGRRTMTRNAFELFQDQIEALRGFSLKEKLRGEKGSVSAMVREAIDMYIAKRHQATDE